MMKAIGESFDETLRPFANSSRKKLQEVQDHDSGAQESRIISNKLMNRRGEVRGGKKIDLRDRRTGNGAAGLILGAAESDPGVSGLRRQRPRPVPVPAGVAERLKVLARSRRPILCMRSLFSRILSSLWRS
jgi:hypothetical protein